MERIWDVKPFISTDKFELAQLLDSDGDVMIRVAIGCKKAYPTSAFINSVQASEYQEMQKYNLEFFDRMMVNPFNNRLLTQLGNPLFSDAVLSVVGKDDEEIKRIPVHGVIISGKNFFLQGILETTKLMY